MPPNNRGFDPIAECEKNIDVENLTDVPAFPVAAPAPLFGAQAQRSQDTIANVEYCIEARFAKPGSSFACQECRDRFSSPSSETKIDHLNSDSSVLASTTLLEKLQLLLEELESSKLLNSWRRADPELRKWDLRSSCTDFRICLRCYCSCCCCRVNVAAAAAPLLLQCCCCVLLLMLAC